MGMDFLFMPFFLLKMLLYILLFDVMLYLYMWMKYISTFVNLAVLMILIIISPC